MAREYPISVAMATYNGEKYIREQLNSILKQLDVHDEIIISDDGSKDGTIEAIKELNDERIKIIDGPKMGVKQNFANAIKVCNGKYIFLADQDDIWMEGKIEKVLQFFNKTKAKCVVHDALVFHDSTNETIFDSFFNFRKSRAGILKNIWKNSYIGCCMAFDSELKKYILPIPNNIEMHDQWIGLIAEKYGQSIYINDILLKYRRHGNNASELKHHAVIKMLKNRIVLIYEFIRRVS